MSVTEFIRKAPAGTGDVMQIFGAAESLTDEVAIKLYAIKPIAGLDANHFLLALHQSSFVEPRNFEWCFPVTVRDELRNLGTVEKAAIKKAHVNLLSIGMKADPCTVGRSVPRYLATDAGKAYHSAYAGKVDQALALYTQVASSWESFSGIHWLASRFSVEQQAAKILPTDATNLLFLQAMSLYREQRKKEAMPLFERIVAKDETSKFTAVACDILGVSLRRRNRQSAEHLFRRAISISKEIGDHNGEGVHLHNLALVLDRRGEEAEPTFRAALEIAKEQGDEYSAAIRKNGLADHLAHSRREHRPEAEQLLTEAIAYFLACGEEEKLGSPMNTLARLLSMNKDRTEEAEQLYRLTIQIALRYDDRKGLSLRRSGLAKLLAKNPARYGEAKKLLTENLEMAKEDNDLKLIERMVREIEKLPAPSPSPA